MLSSTNCVQEFVQEFVDDNIGADIATLSQYPVRGSLVSVWSTSSGRLTLPRSELYKEIPLLIGWFKTSTVAVKLKHKDYLFCMEKEIPQEPKHHVAKQEQRERELYNRAMWAGGLFEIGGGMYFTSQASQNKKGGMYLYARPVVQFTDNNEEGVKKLQELFGGIVRNKRGTKNSWEWLLQGHRAIPFALAVRPFTPSRHEFMVIAERWDSMTPEERYEAVKDTQGDPHNKKRVVLASDAYAVLIQHPAFVAGVVDCRGSMQKQKLKDGYSEFPNIDIPTNNLTLLETLQSTFGGSIHVRGESLESEGSFLYKLSYKAAKTIYEFVRPHLLLRV